MTERNKKIEQRNDEEKNSEKLQTITQTTHFFFSLENILFLRDEPEVLDATLPVDFVEMGFSIVVP